MDPKLKKELEVFVGGLPYDIQEKEVSFFFEKSNVKFTSLRALNGDDGKFKGIIFAICDNKDSVLKALALNG